MDAVDATRSQHHDQVPQSQKQKRVKTGAWLPAEDARLREAVAKHSTRWVSVASEVGTRNGDQCAKRWSENLNPELDHSPWTQEEEERLLCLVNIYGHNWKFMANSFLEARAPLALKNRYSLLMRRLKRQGIQQEQEVVVADGTRSPPDISIPVVSSGSEPPFTTNDVDLINYCVCNKSSHSCQSGYTPLSPTAKNTILPANSFDADMIFTHDTHDDQQRTGGIASRTVTTAWDDHDTVWRLQQNPCWGFEMESDSASSNTKPTIVGEIDLDKMTMVSDNGTGSKGLPQSLGGRKLHSPLVSHSESSGIVAAAAVEYSVTCRRGRLKTLVNYLMDAAMSEIAGQVREDDQMTITLQLKA